MNYGMPWIRQRPVAGGRDHPAAARPQGLLRHGQRPQRRPGRPLTASHTHRFARNHEITTKVRRGAYERDQRAGTVRFGHAATQPDRLAVTLDTFGPARVITAARS
jgi:catecholate siderophore receptor